MKSHLLRGTLFIGLISAILATVLPVKADSPQIHQYQPLLKLGRGEIISVDWQAASKKILVNTRAGVWLYDDQLRDVAHLENLTLASFNLKGDLIAGKRDNKIILLDADSFQPTRTLLDYADTLLDLKWSPDSGKIAGLWKNGQVVIWDAKTYRQLFVFWQSKETNTFAWSPDSTKVVALDPGGNTASIWRVETGQRKLVLPLKLKSKYSTGGGSLVWSADGNQLMRRVGVSELALFQRWDAQNAELLYETENDGVFSIAYSPDGQKLILDYFFRMQLVDPKTFKSLVDYNPSPASTIARWSPDGRIIAGFGTEWLLSDGFVSLWDASTGKRVHYFTSHSSVISFLWGSDSRRFLTVNRDNVIRILDADSGAVLYERSEHTLVSRVTAWNFEGNKIAIADTIGTVRIWDVKTKQLKFTLKGTSDILQMAWQPNGKLLAIASEIGESGGIGVAHNVFVRLWDTESGQNVATFPFNDKSTISSLAWDKTGKQLLTATYYGKFVLWDIATQKFTLFFDYQADKNLAGIVVSLASFSPDGTKLLILSDACCVGPVPSIWDIKTAKPVANPPVDIRWVLNSRGYSWDESSEMLFRADWPTKNSYCGDGGCGDPLKDPRRFKVFIETIYPLNTSTETLPRIILQGHTDYITSTIWSPDTHTIATTSLDKTLRTWKAETGQPLLVIGNVDLMAWSPDSRLIAAWAIGGPTRILEASTGKLLDTLDIPNGATQWSPDSTKLVHSEGGLLTVWGNQ